MNPDITSLSNLHDIVLPPEVGWWPLAPGWYGVLLVLALVVLLTGWRALKRWKSNAYRRAALRELGTLHGDTATAELLRRTALACVPREQVARLTGRAWPAWLAAQVPVAMPEVVRERLAGGLYGPVGSDREGSALRDYAAQWVMHHQIVVAEEHPQT